MRCADDIWINHESTTRRQPLDLGAREKKKLYLKKNDTLWDAWTALCLARRIPPLLVTRPLVDSRHRKPHSPINPQKHNESSVVNTVSSSTVVPICDKTPLPRNARPSPRSSGYPFYLIVNSRYHKAPCRTQFCEGSFANFCACRAILDFLGPAWQ